ncbi:phytoene dehydrogenase-like oxidoreductase [Aequorivita sublithincola DSM 14238]|uniref:Phytoene dehydrogenase-like oxidoreductase n=1 Tax=Aequorivita sublithincola (strain DSM 14238 / LMG 21431 / ACAM 643 / 9-3) TaxID=746697 RepID=I3YRG9_AEQSU|nr:NAD(P)/FAD-dependent oxidoreductase [Aequorivita sublithincola]AFL79587.1 phytoene dehydrogenase-like oxidoreductase [Aequorivita sublithincola DSM 14238]
MKNNSSNFPESHFDTIIIGSGVGGLTAAIILSRAGQKVLVLEQHDVPGGWCHSFYLNGHRFTPGVHYVGLLEKGQSTAKLYESLGIADDLTFFRMNPSAYEHAYIGEERFNFPGNFDDLVSALVEKFPKEENNIKKYLNLVRTVSSELQKLPNVEGFWQHLTIPFRTKHMGKYALFSLKRVIDWHIKDPLLKKILNIQFGDHGLAPAKASFPLHCAVMDHYFHGGFYPCGGGGAIVKAMTTAIKKHNGIVKTQQSVKKILLEGGKKKTVIGVELESGEKLFAKQVISNADPNITYQKLIGEENLSKSLQKKLNRTKYSCSSLMLFLTVAMDVKAAGLDSGNIWLMPNEDMDRVYERMMMPDITNDEAIEGMFVSCTTLKDPSSFDGKHHSIEAITYLDYKLFEKFKDEKEPRSEEYLQFKELLTEKMIKTLEKVLPNIREHIVHKELGTPITNQYYINSTDGSVYGTEKKLMQIGPFAYKAKSEIKNLYLCGASIVSHGVAGAGYSGLQTAGEILNLKQKDLLKTETDQSITILEAEDNTDYPEWLNNKVESKKRKVESN